MYIAPKVGYIREEATAISSTTLNLFQKVFVVFNRILRSVLSVIFNLYPSYRNIMLIIRQYLDNTISLFYLFELQYDSMKKIIKKLSYDNVCSHNFQMKHGCHTLE